MQKAVKKCSLFATPNFHSEINWPLELPHYWSTVLHSQKIQKKNNAPWENISNHYCAPRKLLTFIMQCDTIGDWQELIKFRSIADSTTKPHYTWPITSPLYGLFLVRFPRDYHDAFCLLFVQSRFMCIYHISLIYYIMHLCELANFKVHFF